jgi:hypothetical protein
MSRPVFLLVKSLQEYFAAKNEYDKALKYSKETFFTV